MTTDTLLPIGARVRLRPDTFGVPQEWCHRASPIVTYAFPLTRGPYVVMVDGTAYPAEVGEEDIAEVVNGDTRRAA